MCAGRLDCNVQRGRELLSLLESGGLDGLSIGFKTVNAAREKFTNTRRLLNIDLWEVSLVTFPMLEGRPRRDHEAAGPAGRRTDLSTTNHSQGVRTDMDANTGLETKVLAGDAMGDV